MGISPLDAGTDKLGHICIDVGKSLKIAFGVARRNAGDTACTVA
jgi:hypothetical protein